MNGTCSVANDGQMLPFSLDRGFDFSAPPTSDVALQSYGKVCAIGTTMVTGVVFCAQGMKTMFSGTDDEPFSLQRKRSFRACSYFYTGITAVAGAVFLAYAGST